MIMKKSEAMAVRSKTSTLQNEMIHFQSGTGFSGMGFLFILPGSGLHGP